VARDLSSPAEAHNEDNLLIEAVSLLVQRQRETEAWVAEQVEQADERAASVERHYTALESRLAGIEEQLDSLIREVEPGRGDAVVGQRLARLREQVADLRSDSDGRSLRSVPSATPVEPQAAPRQPDAYPVPPTSGSAPDTYRGSPPTSGSAPDTYRGSPPTSGSAPDAYRESPPASGSAPEAYRTLTPSATDAPIAAEAPRASSSSTPGLSAVAAGLASSTAGGRASFWELTGPTSRERFGLAVIGLGVVAVLYAVLTQLRF
jgi:hypothetical protein